MVSMVLPLAAARRLAPTWLHRGNMPCVLSLAALHTTRALAARGDGYKGRDRSRNTNNNKRDTDDDPSPSKASANPTDIDREAEWRRLRAKTFAVARDRDRDPLDAPIKKALQERARKRRLGLLPEGDDDDDEQFATEYRAQLEQKQQQRMQREKRAAASAEKKALRESDSESARPRRAVRRPVAPSDKVFTGLRSAPDGIVEREFLEPDEPSDPKGLDIAIIGRPNAGKSSIINSLLDVTVSAVSPKYNTTRDRVLGILTERNAQLTFYDTPGLIKPKESHQYVRELVTTASETVESVDLSLLVVDAVKRLDDDAMEALEQFVTTAAQVSSPLMLVMNKCDLVGDRERLNLKHRIHDLSQMIQEVYKTHYVVDDFEDNFEDDEDDDEDDGEGSDEEDMRAMQSMELKMDPLQFIGDNALRVSALKGTGMADLKKTLLGLAVDRPWSYHSSFKSDQSDLDLVTEIIREKLFRRYNKELPYAIQQENVGWTIFRDRSIRIDQDLFVSAPRVRKMVVGHNGNSIRSVGVAAREEIERLLGCPVHLYLNVRVRDKMQ